jgi:HrpA-like RNA helicase
MQAIEAAIEKRVDILPLHANLSSDEQRKVFHKTQSKWKIVCSTNVAEVRRVSCLFLR